MSTQNSKKLIVIVGPTAIGKTGLSIKLAKYFNCEILSADSRQFYKEMEIGTAKPNADEMDGIPHHFVGHLSIKEQYTAGKFEKDVIDKLQSIYKTQNTAILVGGSGLFVNAVCFGLDDIPSNSDIREQLIKELETEGIEKLQSELKTADPEYYDTADIQNPHRVIRALETYRTTKKPYSSFRNSTQKKRPFEIIWIGLNMERDQVYANINKRVDIMMENGLLEEVNKLEPFKDLNCLKTVGYQEFYQNPRNFEKAVELVKQNTRRFAKRQITFFKRNDKIKWFNPNQVNEIIAYIKS